MLRDDQIERYARHILLPDVGGVGQKRLLAAAVVVELGPDPAAESVALAYLAAAGVGRLLLAGDVDGTVTDAEARVSILLGAGDVGHPRIQAITSRVAALNPDVRVARVPVAGAAPHNAVPLAAAPAAMPGPGAPDAFPAPADPAAPGSVAVADALIRGGARAVRTLSQLAQPDGSLEPS